MIYELLTGQHSPEEQQLRYKLRFLWQSDGYSAADPIVNLLLHDNDRDGLLWGMRYILDTRKSPDYHSGIRRSCELVESDLSLEEQFRMLYFLLEDHQDTLIINFVTVFVQKICRVDSIPDNHIPLYQKAGERLIAAGLISLGRDLLEFLLDTAPIKASIAAYSSMVSMVGDVRENPQNEFRALFQMLLKRFNIQLSAETTAEVHENWHEPMLMAWFNLMNESPVPRYQYMTREERIEYLAGLADKTMYFVKHPEERSLDDILRGLFVLDIEWREELFGLEVDPDVPSEDESDSMHLPEFDDEDYLRCVDFVLDHFDHYLPDNKAEIKAFVPLLYLPIYAMDYKMPELRSDLEVKVDGTYLATFIRDMAEVVQILWEMLSEYDEVGKALMAIDANDILLEHCGEGVSTEAIEIFISTLKTEKKTIQRVMKEYRHGER